MNMNMLICDHYVDTEDDIDRRTQFFHDHES